MPHARLPLQLKYCLPNLTMRAKFIKSLNIIAGHFDGGAKVKRLGTFLWYVGFSSLI
jgi:hypothetical protein